VCAPPNTAANPDDHPPRRRGPPRTSAAGPGQFDRAAARAYATIAAQRRAAGRPISQFDCQIAAIARAREATVATRNTSDYEGCGIELIDPWAFSARP
jgi:predicted nucleic acid-binding protein